MLRLRWGPIELADRQHDVPRRGSLQLEHIGARWKGPKQVVLAGTDKVQLHVFEVPNGLVVDQRLVPEQAWHIGTLNCWQGDLALADVIGAIMAKCHWQLAVVVALLRAMSYTAD